MPYVVSVSAVCPMRRDASHKSEMVSQLLFGEPGEILEDGKDFTKIKCLYDDYEGWCAKSQLAETDDIIALNPVAFTKEKNATAWLNHTIVPLSLATPVFAKVSLDKYTIGFDEDVLLQEDKGETLLPSVGELAVKYLNTPYLWGGKSSVGIDCSGFTQQVLKMMGIKLMRDAYQQATQGEVVGFLEEVIPGDLAFFDNEEGRITHAGILLNSDTIIHASGYVRVDKIDSQGIIHSYTGKRTHTLRIIKRMATPPPPSDRSSGRA